MALDASQTPLGACGDRLVIRWYVISRARPDNVASMRTHLPDVETTWVVPPEDELAYADAGADRILATVGLSAARNLALDDAFADGSTCVQLDDDLKKIETLDLDSRATRPTTLAAAIHSINVVMDEIGARLGGASSTPNPYFVRRPLSTKHFVIGSLSVVKPTDLRYSTRLRLKEDYDYTLRHIVTYGLVARVDPILPTFQHYSNPGGAVDSRSDEAEQHAIAELRADWGHLVSRGRNINEIRINSRAL